MRKNSFRLFVLLTALFVSSASFAQIINPAKWTFKTKQISSSEAELQFTVKLDAGWHIYSQFTEDGGPLPLIFEFDESTDYKRIDGVKEPKPIVEFDDIFKVTVKHFAGTVTFTQKVKTLTTKDYQIKGTLE